MKPNTLPATLTLALAALLAAPALFADDHHKCTNKSVAGDWGYTATGTRIGVGLIAAVGTFTLDADGNVLDGRQTVSFNGFAAQETFSGTYVLNEDCTGTAILNVTSPVLNRTSHVSLVDVDDATESRLIFTDPGTIITMEAKRLFSPGH